MENEIVLFLHDRVPHPDLLAALADVFGISPHASDAPLVVGYVQGFAIGVSIPDNGKLTTHRAADTLSTRLNTEVLLESCDPCKDGADWLLFTPGAPHPRAVQIVELRHGLDIADPVPTYGAVASDGNSRRKAITDHRMT